MVSTGDAQRLAMTLQMERFFTFDVIWGLGFPAPSLLLFQGTEDLRCFVPTPRSAPFFVQYLYLNSPEYIHFSFQSMTSQGQCTYNANDPNLETSKQAQILLWPSFISSNPNDLIVCFSKVMAQCLSFSKQFSLVFSIDGWMFSQLTQSCIQSHHAFVRKGPDLKWRGGGGGAWLGVLGCVLQLCPPPNPPRAEHPNPESDPLNKISDPPMSIQVPGFRNPPPPRKQVLLVSVKDSRFSEQTSNFRTWFWIYLQTYRENTTVDFACSRQHCHLEKWAQYWPPEIWYFRTTLG